MPYRLHISEEEVKEELSRLGYKEVPPKMVASFRKDLLQLIKADIKQLKRQKSLQSSQLGRSSLSNEESSRSATNHSSSMTADSSVTLRSQSSSPVNSMGGLLRSMSEPSMSADTSDSHVLHTCGDDSLPSSALGLQRRMDKQHRRKSRRQSPPHQLEADAESGYSENESVDNSSEASAGISTATTSSGFSSSGSTAPSEHAAPATATRKRAPSLPAYPRRPDPVSLYHYYRAHWEAHPPPGEDPRAALRWKIRAELFYSN